MRVPGHSRGISRHRSKFNAIWAIRSAALTLRAATVSRKGEKPISQQEIARGRWKCWVDERYSEGAKAERIRVDAVSAGIGKSPHERSRHLRPLRPERPIIPTSLDGSQRVAIEGNALRRQC